MKKVMFARRSLAVAFAFVLLTAHPSSAATASDTYELGVKSITNKSRVSNGKVALSHQWCVDKYAEENARIMASRRVLAHQSLSRILRNCNLSRVGENIAKGYSTPSLVMAAWMASSGHKANILNYRYRLIGVGAVRDQYGRWWVSQVFGTR